MSLTTAKEVSRLMTSSKTLCALQFAYECRSFEENYSTLKNLIFQTPKGCIALAPELCLSGYSYTDMEGAAAFSARILPSLCELSTTRTFGLTLITKEGTHFYNTFMLFHHEHCIYSQHKAKLFSLGDEEVYFNAGELTNIKIIDVEGIKIAVLICFELRFPSLWEQIKGADIILVPSFWGEPRKVHLETLSQALAITNQAYVLCANSADEGMAKGSGIITPFGICVREDEHSLITHAFDTKEIKTMRKYINTGLQHHASNGSL